MPTQNHSECLISKCFPEIQAYTQPTLSLHSAYTKMDKIKQNCDDGVVDMTRIYPRLVADLSMICHGFIANSSRMTEIYQSVKSDEEALNETVTLRVNRKFSREFWGLDRVNSQSPLSFL